MKPVYALLLHPFIYLVEKVHYKTNNRFSFTIATSNRINGFLKSELQFFVYIGNLDLVETYQLTLQYVFRSKGLQKLFL